MAAGAAMAVGGGEGGVAVGAEGALGKRMRFQFMDDGRKTVASFERVELSFCHFFEIARDDFEKKIYEGHVALLLLTGLLW